MIKGVQPGATERPEGGRPRRYDVDWLRVLAVLGLIPLHAGFAVDEALPAGVLVPGSTLAPVNWLTHLMLRTLLFLLAGMAAWHALGRRNDLQYLSERTRRLVVPLIVVMVALGPLVFYLDLRQRGLYEGGLLSYLSLYFGGFFFDLPARTLHMWFVLYLFIFALITLPAFRLLREGFGASLLRGALPLIRRPWLLALVVLPLALLAAVLQAEDNTTTRLLVGDSMSTLGYLAVMVYGFLLAAEPSLEQPLVRHRSRFMAVALLAGLLIVPLHWNGEWPDAHQVLPRAGALAVVAGGTWFMILGLLGYGFAHLNRPGRLVQYLSRASAAVYVMHLPANAVAAFLILPLRLGGLGSYLTIMATSLGGIYLTYELLVRRIAPLRLLCGLPLHVPPPEPLPLPQTAARCDTATAEARHAS
jgi:glucan biosynthesis protein C